MDLVRTAGRGVHDWTVPALQLGVLAEGGCVTLPDIGARGIIQCAFPHVSHDCDHDVFVLARWDTET